MIVQWRKWDGSPHWRHECVYLGADDWGDWVGQPQGWLASRPAASFRAAGPNVLLIPPAEPGSDGALYAPSVNRDHPVRVYIDLGWDISWSEDPLLVTGIDMDLDVVRAVDGRGTWVDDRDEWEDHRVQYGYPPEVVAQLEALALDLESRVLDQLPPFDDAVPDQWLDRLAAYGFGPRWPGTP